MEVQEALWRGASIGMTIAAPIGPMAVLVIRRTVSSGFVAGIVTGAGASTTHFLYAALSACGIGRIAGQIQGQQTLMGVVTALILFFFSIRMLRPRSAVGGAVAVRQSPIGNYASALAFNLMNPMGFALTLGAVTAVSSLASLNLSDAITLAGGVFAGSIAWWIGLVTLTTTIGSKISARVSRMIDIAAALLLLGLALSTMSRLI